MKKIYKNSGFTLIETMFAVAILLVLALASASLAKLASDGNRYADRKNAQSALAQLTIENLRHANSCDKAIGPGSGLGLTIDDTLIRQPGSTGGWPLTVKIAGLNSGPSMTGDTMSNTTILPLKRLRVEELKLAEAVELETTATDRTYLAAIFLRTADVGGISHKPILVGTVTLKTELATGAVISCETSKSASIKNTCEDIGCTYNAALTPACRCSRTRVVCAAPGYMPVAFTADGLPDCRPIGGDVQCPPGEFLIGVGIDWHKCGPAPTTVAGATPAPAGVFMVTKSPTLYCTGSPISTFTRSTFWPPFHVPPGTACLERITGSCGALPGPALPICFNLGQDFMIAYDGPVNNPNDPSIFVSGIYLTTAVLTTPPNFPSGTFLGWGATAPGLHLPWVGPTVACPQPSGNLAAGYCASGTYSCPTATTPTCD